MRMRYAGTAMLAAAAALAGAEGARADHVPTTISWPGWTVSSSENLYLGRTHTSYPLTHLFDGRAETAWVFSGNRPQRLKDPTQVDSLHAPEDGRFIITIRPDKPVAMDSVRIINGYAKSQALYEKNNRASEVLVTINGENRVGGPVDARPAAVKAALRDTTDAQAVSFPRQAVGVLTIEVTGVRKGTVDDLCLSELELWCDGRKIDLGMPGVVRFTTGDECGCGTTYWMVRRDGTAIVADNTCEMGDGIAEDQPVPSPDRRRLAGVTVREKDNAKTAWVLDAATGEVLLQSPLPKGDYQSIAWKDADTVVIERAKKKPLPVVLHVEKSTSRPAGAARK